VGDAEDFERSGLGDTLGDLGGDCQPGLWRTGGRETVIGDGAGSQDTGQRLDPVRIGHAADESGGIVEVVDAEDAIVLAATLGKVVDRGASEARAGGADLQRRNLQIRVESHQSRVLETLDAEDAVGALQPANEMEGRADVRVHGRELMRRCAVPNVTPG
jgi:hypothetical protein